VNPYLSFKKNHFALVHTNISEVTHARQTRVVHQDPAFKDMMLVRRSTLDYSVR